MNERHYLSIGEVLGLLLEEFPDITISKIRFLESQGLIEPERAASGYRRFYDVDIDRLRFILREQKDHYLPLKVIKDRLGSDPTPDNGLPRGIRNVTVDAPETAPEVEARQAEAPAEAVAAAGANSEPTPTRTGARASAAKAPATAHPSAARPTTAATTEDKAPAPAPVGDKLPIAPATTTGHAPEPKQAPTARPPAAKSSPPEPAPAGSQLSRSELITAAGIDGALLDNLEAFGLVTSRSLGQQPVYDQHALVVAEIAGKFAALGIDARHLRTFKTSAEREADLYEQRILPLLRQRNPQARDDSMRLLDDLADLGSRIHAAFVDHTLSPHRGSR